MYHNKVIQWPVVGFSRTVQIYSALAPETIDNGDADKNGKEKNHDCRSLGPPFTSTILIIMYVYMCAKVIQSYRYTIKVRRVRRRVNKGCVPCARE